MTSSKLPRGIRNCNPGNLRGLCSINLEHHVLDGFAVFRSMDDGCAALADLIHYYYEIRRLRTVTAFMEVYAPQTENDTKAYVVFVEKWLGHGGLWRVDNDMKLNCVWNVIDLMRALICFENGRPSLQWPTSPEWCSPQEILAGLHTAAFWDDEINGHQIDAARV